MNQTIKVLLVEDDLDIARMIQDSIAGLSGNPYELCHVNSLSHAGRRVHTEKIEVILLNLSLPDSQGMDTLKKTANIAPDIPIVVITSQDDEARALEAIYEGAEDYLIKDQINGNMLSRVMRYGMERKRAQRELSDAREAAEIANSSRSQFLANMSHEIRTPLTGVIGMTELLMRTELTGQQREFADIIKISANTLISVVNDILDISKIEAGRMNIVISEFKPREQIEDVIKTLYASARPKDLKLSFDISSDVPKRLYGDTLRVRQILTNLVGNAVKFTSAGEISVFVELTDKTDDSATLRISVHDTGIGISQDDLDNIFESFTQVDGSSTREYGGTGLGLSICSGLVKMLGGELGVESDVGEGSTFWFTVQMEKQFRPVEETRPHKPSAEIKRAGVKVNVLVAEDNDINYKVASSILTQLDCSVARAKNGIEAVQMSENNGYDLILMDIQMPEMNGVKATREIRKRENKTGNHTPIVALTAHAMKGDRDRCLEAGLDGYITKPVVFDDLRDALSRYVQGEPAHTH